MAPLHFGIRSAGARLSPDQGHIIYSRANKSESSEVVKLEHIWHFQRVSVLRGKADAANDRPFGSVDAVGKTMPFDRASLTKTPTSGQLRAPLLPLKLDFSPYDGVHLFS